MPADIIKGDVLVMSSCTGVETVRSTAGYRQGKVSEALHKPVMLRSHRDVLSLRRSEGLEKRPVHCENLRASQTVSRPRIQPL